MNLKLIIDIGTNEIRIIESVTVLEIIDFMKKHNFDESEWKIVGNLNSRHTEIFPIYIPQTPIVPDNPYWKDHVIYCTQ